MTVLHLQPGAVLAAISSGGAELGVGQLTGGAHLAVRAGFAPAAFVEVPVAELTAVTLTAPARVLERPRDYVVQDAGGPQVGLGSNDSVVEIKDATKIFADGLPAGAGYVAVLQTVEGPTVDRGTVPSAGELTVDARVALQAALLTVAGHVAMVETA